MTEPPQDPRLFAEQPIDAVLAVHKVVALVRPVQSTFELACAAEVFGAVREGVRQRYRFETCTEHPGRVATSAGYEIHVEQGLSALSSADTVIIPGWLPVETPLSTGVRQALLRAHDRGARLVAICSGTFALAHTSLLDGRSATIDRARSDLLRREFPSIVVKPDVPYVDHGDVATSGNAGSAVELCLHLVQKDQGAAHAVMVARQMGLSPRREGTVRPTHVAPPVGAFRDVLAWAASRLDDIDGVDDLADRLNVSSRTLTRRFAHHVGMSPGAWLLSRRIDLVRHLLEHTDLTVDAIASRAGLGSGVNLRRRFRQHVGTTPSAYRRAARNSHAPARAPAWNAKEELGARNAQLDKPSSRSGSHLPGSGLLEALANAREPAADRATG